MTLGRALWPVEPPGREDRVVLVSIPKSGTHMVSRMFQALGYRIEWQLMHEVPEVLPADRWAHNLRTLSGGTCLVVHRLTPRNMPWEFVQQWQQDDSPIRVVFNYRDPRDTLLSGIHALLNGEGFQSPAFLVLKGILQTMETRSRQLDYLLTDLHSSSVGTLNPIELYRELSWLLFHPGVSRVGYESLVGPRGGGSRDVQLQTVHQLVSALGLEADSTDLADRLYSDRAPTFRRGQIGDWRTEFTPEQAARFSDLHSDILRMYGYQQEHVLHTVGDAAVPQVEAT